MYTTYVSLIMVSVKLCCFMMLLLDYNSYIIFFTIIMHVIAGFRSLGSSNI